MSIWLRPSPATVACALALSLGACATQGPGTLSEPAPATPAPTLLPASIPARDLVGRWGFASYHKDEDRARTETAARGQCNQPYAINSGPRGGIIMHLADQTQPTELGLKGGPGGKNYVGPMDEPGGSARDREILAFDGRVLVLKWIDPEVAGRYGIGVYVRCGAPGTPVAKRKPAPKKS